MSGTTSDTWIGVSGDWTTGSDWSGQQPPTASQAAAIALSSPGTVTIGSGETVQAGSVTLGTVATTLDVAGTLNLAGTATLSAGQLILDGGTITGGTINPAGGTVTITNTSAGTGSSTNSQGTLDGVTVIGDLSIAYPGNPPFDYNPFPTLTMTGGSRIYADSSQTTPGLLSLSKTSLDLGPTQSQTLNYSVTLYIGTLSLNGPSASLTIAQGVSVLLGFSTLQSAGALINDGTIGITQQGLNDTITAGQFVNNGVIAWDYASLANTSPNQIRVTSFDNAVAGVMDIGNTAVNLAASQSASNEGVIDAAAGSTLLLGTFTNSGTITIESGATVNIAALTNSGVIDVQAGGTLVLNAANANSNTGSIVLQGGTLQLSGDETVSGINALNITTGTSTASGAVSSIAYLSGTLANAGGTITPSSLPPSFYFAGGTIQGGTLDLTQGSLTFNAPAGNGTTNGVLSLGCTLDSVTVLGNLQVAGGLLLLINGSSVYRDSSRTAGGTITLQNAAALQMIGSNYNGTVDLLAQITGGNGSVTLGNGSSAITNIAATASVTVTAGGSITIYGQLINNGTISVDHAALNIVGSNTLINQGTITATDSAVTLGGSLNLAELGDFNRVGGSLTFGGPGPDIFGNGGSRSDTYDNTGEVLDGSSTSFVGATFNNATIKGGTLNEVALGASFNGVTLDGVAVEGNISAGGTGLTLIDGSMIYSDATQSRLGTITITGGNLTWITAAPQIIAQNIVLANANFYLAGPNYTSQTVTIAAGAVISGSGAIQVQSSQFAPNNTPQPTLTLTNDGLIEANAGGITVQADTFTNLVGGVLTGGSYEASNNSFLVVNSTQAVSTLAATVTLVGGGAYTGHGNDFITRLVDGTQIALESSLTTVAAGGALVLQGGEVFNATGTVTNNGIISVTGGSTFNATSLINNGELIVDPTSSAAATNLINNGTEVLYGGTFTGIANAVGATLKGFGTFNGPVTNNGIIEASGGTLVIDGSVSGSGGFVVDAGAKLVLNGDSGQTVTFSGAGGEFNIANPGFFSGSLANVTPGDSIDISGLAVASTALTAGGSTGQQLTFTHQNGITNSAQLNSTSITLTNSASIVLPAASVLQQFDGITGSLNTILPLPLSDVALFNTQVVVGSGTDADPALNYSYAGQAGSTSAQAPSSFGQDGNNYYLTFAPLQAGAAPLAFGLTASSRNTGPNPEAETVTFVLIANGGDIASSSGPMTITGLLPGSTATVPLGPELVLQNGNPSVFLVHTTTASGVQLPDETLTIAVDPLNLAHVFQDVSAGGGGGGGSGGSGSGSGGTGSGGTGSGGTGSGGTGSNGGAGTDTGIGPGPYNQPPPPPPPPNVINYVPPPPPPPPPPAISSGDPHLSTFDGLFYDLQQVGEFTLARSTALGDSFDVQIRTAPYYGFSSTVAGIYQASVQVGTDIVNFDPTRQNVLLIDGTAPTLATGGVVTLAGGIVRQLSYNTWQVIEATGEQVTVHCDGPGNGSTNVGPLTIAVSVAGSFSAGGFVQGLDGNGDGNPANDFMLPDGTVLPQPLQPGQLYQQFARAWAVTNATSILVYPGGTPNTAAFTNTAFPVGQPSLAALPAQLVQNATAAVQAAGLNPNSTIGQAAVLDYATSNDPGAIAAAVMQQQANPTPAAVGPTSATGTADSGSGSAPSIGVYAPSVSVQESSTALVPVVFQIYATTAVTADTQVAWSVVGSSVFTAATFGGTLPSGTATITAGSTTANFTVNLPAGVLGSDPQDTLTVQITPPAANPTVGGAATVVIGNAAPQPGIAAVPAFILQGGNGTLTGSGTSYTLDLGSIALNSSAPVSQLQVVNQSGSGGDTLAATLATTPGTGTGAITLTGLSSISQLAAGGVTGAITVTPSTATAGNESITLTLNGTETNASGFSSTLAPVVLTILADIITPPGANNQALVAGPGALPVPVPDATPAVTVVSNAGATPIGVKAPSDSGYATTSLVITASALPTDGTVTLADGTLVSAGQVLTATQLTGLLFTPTRANATSSFVYTVADPGGATTTGSVALNTGPALGGPVLSSPTLSVAANAGATQIGIGLPTDPNYTGSQLTFSVTGLPTDGTVSLGTGGAVTAGEALTLSQLANLQFTPSGASGDSSTFSYSATDPGSATGTGTATLTLTAPTSGPISTPTTLTVAENATASAIGITAPTDVSYPASQVTITATSLPSDGLVTLADGVTPVTAGQTLTVAQLTGLLFTPTAGTFGASSDFRYSLTDPGNGSATGSATLAVGPAIGNPVVTSASLTVAANSAATAIGIAAPTDPNYQAGAISVTINTLPTDGVVALAGGAAVAAGQVLTVAQLTGLTFAPTAGAVGVSSSLGYTAADPAANATSGTATLAIAAGPESYTITGTGAVATTDAAPVDPFATLALSDTNPAAIGTATVVLSSVANGTLSQLGEGTLSGNTYTVSGSTAAIQAALQGLVFTPTPHQATPGSTVTTGFALTLADKAATATASASVVATALEDAPVIGGMLAGQTIAPSGTVRPFATATITDPDFGASETATITLSAAAGPTDANGTLSGTGLTQTAPGTYTLAAASPAAEQAALAALVFTATATPSTTRFTLQVSDAIAPPVTDSTTTVTVSAVPPPPVLTTGAEISDAPSPSIDGTAEAGSTVALRVNGVASGSTVAGSDGRFSLAATLPPGLNSLSVTTTTAGGTSAGSAPVSVLALPQPVNGISTADVGSATIAAALDSGASPVFISGTSAVQLTDGTLNVGPDTNEATVQRLYVALLGRAGDPGGLSFFDGLLASGASKADVASAMLASPEYAADHGSLSNQQYVESLYQNVLDRSAAADPGSGIWTSLLAQGTTRAAVAVGIADSVEAKNTQATKTSLLFASNPAGALAHALYETGLAREIELPALASFKAQFGVLTASQFAAEISGSAEFAVDHAGQNNAAYVASLFQAGLGRAPDAAGASFWTGLLNNGTSRGDVLLGIATSSEASVHLTGRIGPG